MTAPATAMPRRVGAGLVVVAALLLAGCSGSSSAPSPEPPGAPTASATPSGSAPPAAATATVGDQSYEFPVLLECTNGTADAPQDRQVVAETADGNARLSVVSYTDPEAARLSGLTLELQDPTWVYSSSFTGEQGPQFQVQARPDGAEGTTLVRAAGNGAPTENLRASWSYRCPPGGITASPTPTAAP
jgi:hypothetical protein